MQKEPRAARLPLPHFRLLTNSEIGSMACPRLHDLRYVRRLSPEQYGPSPAARGTLMHALIAQASENDEVIDAIVRPWLEERSHYIRKDEMGAPADDEAEESLEDLHAQASKTVGIYRRYADHWRRDEFERWETIASEVQVARVIRDEAGKPITDMDVGDDGKKRKRIYLYGGAIDRVVRDRTTGAVWLLETKTTDETDLEGFAQKLSHDAQTRGYAWALAGLDPRYSEIDSPIHVQGVIYDVIRNKLPSVPSVLVACADCKHSKKDHTPEGGCDGSKKCGCTGWRASAMSRAKSDTAHDTTWPVYRAAVEDAGLDPSEYNDIRLALQGAESRFFLRVPYPFTTDEIDRFGAYAEAWARTAIAGEKRTRAGHIAPPNPHVCLAKSPRRCPGGYETACLMGEQDEMALTGFAPRGVRHVELRGVLAEVFATKLGEDPRSRLRIGGGVQDAKVRLENDDYPDELPF